MGHLGLRALKFHPRGATMTSKRNIYLSVFALAGITGALPSYAATGIVPFEGLITNACVLTVGTPGVLAPNSNFTSLSSANSGGVAGTMAVLTTGAGFKVSLDDVSAFTTGNSTNVAFSSTYSGTGATTIGSTSGSTQTAINTGLTNLSVGLSATKTSGSFGAGAYTAAVTVRCE